MDRPGNASLPTVKAIQYNNFNSSDPVGLPNGRASHTQLGARLGPPRDYFNEHFNTREVRGMGREQEAWPPFQVEAGREGADTGLSARNYSHNLSPLVLPKSLATCTRWV